MDGPSWRECYQFIFLARRCPARSEVGDAISQVLNESAALRHRPVPIFRNPGGHGDFFPTPASIAGELIQEPLHVAAKDEGVRDKLTRRPFARAEPDDS